ncbi:MAG TPA: DMT family transporter [Candidatus Kapabacteria bacterium]|nr:DMT family transporter [Candidatus Kapabacteria bacterium]
MSNFRTRNKHLPALILSLLIWGTSFPAMKLALATNHPISIIFYRFTFSFFLLIPFFSVHFKRNIKIIGENKELFILGIFNFLGMLLQLTGIKYTTSTKSVIITQLLTVVVFVLAYFFLKEKLDIWKIMGTLFSLLGAVILSTNLEFKGLFDKGTVKGDLLVLSAVFFWALFVIFTRKFALRFGGFMLLFPSVIATLSLSIPVVILSGNLPINGTGLLISLYLAVFCTIIPTLLFNYALKEVDAVTSSIIGPIEILSAAVISFIFLGERLTLLEMSGGLFVILSVYIVMIKSKNKKLISEAPAAPGIIIVNKNEKGK